MTPEQVGDLLSLAAAFDNRTVGESDVLAWLLVLGDLPFDDARTAVAGHYTDNRTRIMPADVRQRVKAIRRDRLDRVIIAAPPAELTDTPGKYKDELAARVAAVADGFDPRRALHQKDKPRNVQLRAIEGGQE